MVWTKWIWPGLVVVALLLALALWFESAPPDEAGETDGPSQAALSSSAMPA